MCKLHWIQQQTQREPWDKVLARIKDKGKGRKYDCLVGISGGEDSSVLLYLAVKVWNLRVLVFHFNNRTDRPEATNNIKVLRDYLNVNFIEYYLDKQEYDNLTDAFLKAGLQDSDTPNDVCMSKFLYKTAKDNGIKYLLDGHSFREEGSSPKAWSMIDFTYLNDVYKTWNGKDLVNYPLLTIWDQIWGAVIGLKHVSPYHYANHGRAEVVKILKSLGWQSYGSKHNENIYTAFIGNFLLPRKFGIDKRKTYLSAAIRENKMTKQYAKEILSEPTEFDLNDLGERKERILQLVNSAPIGNRSSYKITNFKRLKPILWILMKLKMFPLSAYNKYCK